METPFPQKKNRTSQVLLKPLKWMLQYFSDSSQVFIFTAIRHHTPTAKVHQTCQPNTFPEGDSDRREGDRGRIDGTEKAERSLEVLRKLAAIRGKKSSLLAAVHSVGRPLCGESASEVGNPATSVSCGLAYAGGVPDILESSRMLTAL